MSSSTYDEVKPIETLYNGVTFRSRLEARWAVFFDMWGIEWQYEPEGFETAAGRWVPDFFLPQVSMMVEVKPTVAAVDQRVIARASAYLTALDSHPVLILPGQPRPINYPVMLGPVEAHADGLQWHIDRFYDQAEPDENGEPVWLWSDVVLNGWYLHERRFFSYCGLAPMEYEEPDDGQCKQARDYRFWAPVKVY